MSSLESSSLLEPPRRVITGHDPEGKSVVIRDEICKPIVLTPRMCRYDIHATSEDPAKIDSEIGKGVWEDETAGLTSIFKDKGNVFTIVDYEIGAQSGLHRTITMDYAIVMRGSITLLLDAGLKVFLKEGDALVQRATMHGWSTKDSTSTCRVAFIVLPAQAPVVDGTCKIASMH